MVSAIGSATAPPARTISTVCSKNASGTKRSLPSITWSLQGWPRALAASCSAPMTMAPRCAPLGPPTTQQVLRVLHTLRSSERRIAVVQFAVGARRRRATIQAPPVPCRLTGVPTLCANANPSVSTALAGASGYRERSSVRRERAPIRRRGRGAVDQRDGAFGQARRLASAGSDREFHDRRAPWRARPPPMRNTTALPPRSTPQASGEHVGPAFEDEGDDAERGNRPSRPGNRRATMVSSTVAPRRDGIAAQPRRPSIILARMASETPSRVVERPRRRASATSWALTAAIRYQLASCSNASAATP